MKKHLLALFLLLPVWASASVAQEAPPPKSGQAADGRRPPRGRDPKFEAALSDCAKSLGASPGQRPDRDKMHACMSAKGFDRPPGGPGGHTGQGKAPPPPPEDETMPPRAGDDAAASSADA